MEKEQVEKMAIDLEEEFVLCGTLSNCGTKRCSRCFSKYLYEQGYRKLPEDSVVLSKEEYEKLKQYEEKVENGACFTQKEWLELCDEEYKRETENLSKVRQLERKETAKEFAEQLKEKIKALKVAEDENYIFKCGFEVLQDNLPEIIDELLKEDER